MKLDLITESEIRRITQERDEARAEVERLRAALEEVGGICWKCCGDGVDPEGVADPDYGQPKCPRCNGLGETEAGFAERTKNGRVIDPPDILGTGI